MNLVARRVSFTEDRAEMLALLCRIFGASQDRRFEWRHLNNPAGTAWSWFLYDRNTGATAAMATVFPRNMYVDGRAVVAGQVGEFAVETNYRTLGPAVLMQRLTFEPVDSGCLAFCYDCPPHDQGMSTFVRLGMPANTEVFRYAYPLRSEEYFEKRLGNRVWTKPAVLAANAALRIRSSRRRSNGMEIASHTGDFNEEFSVLDRSVSSQGTIRASRSAEDLNWRYRKDPLASSCLPERTKGRYHILVARRGGELEAFVVFFIQSDGVASIADLFGRNLANDGKVLLDAVIHICRKENITSVHGFCSEESELRPILTSLGFHRRERNSRIVAYARAEDQIGKLVCSGQRWAFSQVEVML
jgi:hypothetical protein